MPARAMKNLWKRLDAWFLGRMPKKLTPPGLTEARIRDAEDAIGHRLPEDVRESYKIHNGFPCIEIVPGSHRGLMNVGYFLPLVAREKRWGTIGSRSVVNVTLWMRGLLESGKLDNQWVNPTGPIARVIWSPDWIPIFDNTQGDCLVLDLNPPKRGTRGQLIDWVRHDGPVRVLAKSFGGWFRRLVDEVELGRFHLDFQGSSGTLMRKSVWLREERLAQGAS
jgi:cell wall assembly regulator SMI1